MNKINWRRIFKGFAWLICLAGVVVLMSFINVKKQEVKCKKIQILIPGADNFVEIEEIDAILRESDGELVGRNLEKINIHKIEKSIKNNPYIAFVKVYTDMDGVIYVEIKQREPVLRVLNAGGQDYYIDSKGLKMPISPNFTANVLVATGDILEGFGGRVDTLLTPLARDLFNVAMFVKRDTLWDAQIEQMFVNNKKDIELIPRVGNQRIILGNSDSLATKMNSLLMFYKQAMPKVGWNTYKTINLKYSNQIVCEKYDSLELKRINKPIIVDSTALAQDAVVDAMVKSAIQDEINNAANDQSAAAVTKPVVPKTTVVEPIVPNTTAPKPVVKQKTTVATPEKKKEPEKKATTTTKLPVKEETKPKTFAEKMAAKSAVTKATSAQEKQRTDTKKNNK